MTIQEYKENRHAIEADFEDKKRKLYREYAYSNNSIQLDDIVTDHIGSIKVTKIGVYAGADPDRPSECSYFGVVLKKDLTEKKNKKDGTYETRTAYQSNLIK